MSEAVENINSDFSSSDKENLNRGDNHIVWALSPTIEGVLKKVTPKGHISSASLSREILERSGHINEYANGAFLSIPFRETTTKRRASEWIKNVQLLFDPIKVSEYSQLRQRPALHGRLVILGLCLLDTEFKQQLQEDEVFQLLIEELKEPFEHILSEEGKLLFLPSDRVQSLSDEPLENIEDDLLGRYAFARFLARTINSIKITKGAYSIHLSGSWGSGKSTILNFLVSELTSEKKENNGKNQYDGSGKKWVAVKFNAWQNQHIVPPWWPLYNKIVNGSKKYLGIFFRLKEFFWRLFTGQSIILITVVLLFWCLVIFINLWVKNNPDTQWSNIVKNLSEIIALLTTIVGAVLGYSRSLLFGSANAADSFQKYADEPMEKIYDRFGKLEKELSSKNYRLLIIIDDVDRCSSEYVVRLLEGIQTLFRQGSVVFIVAADRKWLHTCFEQVYKDFKETVNEPGKPLGALFLEKTFQLSTPVPGIPEEFKRDYWNKLINIGEEKLKQKVEESRAIVKNKFSESPSDSEINGIVDDSKNKSIQERIAVREEALWHLASPETRRHTEHTLKPFLPLLENNPRALIRLVNMYSVNRARAIMSLQDIKVADLAQWTILTMRWPELAEYLIENPKSISKIGQKKWDGIDDKIAYLFSDEEVMKVINGNKVITPLDITTMEKCAELG